jgi:hypothetical protein
MIGTTSSGIPIFLNNSKFGDVELEIKNTTDRARLASYLEIDSEGRLRTKAVNHKFQHFDNISIRELVGRISLFFFY